MDELRLKAFAKINIGLDVGDKRDDGYHKVRMVMDSVDLYDFVSLEKKTGNNIVLSTNDKELPVDDGNLAVKAAKNYIDYIRKENCDKTDFGLNITIEKNIPKEAGLAGGSTDAAAVIKGMNILFDNKLSLEELMKIGETIGSDVPYCIMGGCALATGRGEILEPIESMPDYYTVIVKIKEGVSTGQAYAELDIQKDRKHPDIEALVEQINKKASLKEISCFMENSFEQVICERIPKLKDISKKLKEAGAVTAMMSGSGPSIFGIFEKEEIAKDCFDYMDREYKDANVYFARRV